MNYPVKNDPDFISSLKLAELIDISHATVKRSMSAFQKRGKINFSRADESNDMPDGCQKSVEIYILNKCDALKITLHLNPSARDSVEKYWHNKQVSHPIGTVPDDLKHLDDTFSIRQIAVLLNAHERKFTDWLVKHKYVYRLNRINVPITPYKEKVKTGKMVLVPRAIADLSVLEPRFTVKGLNHVSEDWAYYLKEMSGDK